jgi:hypothetical protein
VNTSERAHPQAVDFSERLRAEIDRADAEARASAKTRADARAAEDAARAAQARESREQQTSDFFARQAKALEESR